jgi:hypothetical protein
MHREAKGQTAKHMGEKGDLSGIRGKMGMKVTNPIVGKPRQQPTRVRQIDEVEEPWSITSSGEAQRQQ